MAALEYLVHVDADDTPKDLVLLEVVFSSNAPVETWHEADLPTNWRAATPPSECQARGDAWAAAGEALAVWVPSVLIPTEQNALLNPAHPAMTNVRVSRVTPFAFDPRVLA